MFKNLIKLIFKLRTCLSLYDFFYIIIQNQTDIWFIIRNKNKINLICLIFFRQEAGRKVFGRFDIIWFSAKIFFFRHFLVLFFFGIGILFIHKNCLLSWSIGFL